MDSAGSNPSSDTGISKRAARQFLQSAADAGVTHVKRAARRSVRAPADTTAAQRLSSPRPVAPATETPRQRPSAADVASAATPSAPPIGGPKPASLLEVGPAKPPLPPQERIAALEVIAGEVAGCTRCGELASTRTQTVFGVGNPAARLCFLGEAPGADEDRQGEPFVGRAGQLLTKIIEACRMRREDVYILNVLKCRPPGNRNPLPAEAANCREYLDRQLDIIRPEFICCLGAVAARALLDTPAPIGKLRGKFLRYGPAEVLCTYHPAFLLRNPSAKKDVWEDMKLLMERMGKPIE